MLSVAALEPALQAGMSAAEGRLAAPPARGESMGTTLLALTYAGGVMLAADTCTSSTVVVNRAARKVNRLHDRIFVARCGVAADTQALIQYARRFVAAHALELAGEPTVRSAASLLRLLMYQNRDRLGAGFIVAGVDDRRGPQVIAVDAGGARISEQMTMSGSGSTFVWGFAQETFRPGFTREEAVQFCTRVVSQAMEADVSSGGAIRITIVPTSGEQEELYIPNEGVRSSQFYQDRIAHPQQKFTTREH